MSMAFTDSPIDCDDPDTIHGLPQNTAGADHTQSGLELLSTVSLYPGFQSSQPWTLNIHTDTTTHQHPRMAISYRLPLLPNAMAHANEMVDYYESSQPGLLQDVASTKMYPFPHSVAPVHLPTTASTHCTPVVGYLQSFQGTLVQDAANVYRYPVQYPSTLVPHQSRSTHAGTSTSLPAPPPEALRNGFDSHSVSSRGYRFMQSHFDRRTVLSLAEKYTAGDQISSNLGAAARNAPLAPHAFATHAHAHVSALVGESSTSYSSYSNPHRSHSKADGDQMCSPTYPNDAAGLVNVHSPRAALYLTSMRRDLLDPVPDAVNPSSLFSSGGYDYVDDSKRSAPSAACKVQPLPYHAPEVANYHDYDLSDGGDDGSGEWASVGGGAGGSCEWASVAGGARNRELGAAMQQLLSPMRDDYDPDNSLPSTAEVQPLSYYARDTADNHHQYLTDGGARGSGQWTYVTVGDGAQNLELGAVVQQSSPMRNNYDFDQRLSSAASELQLLSHYTPGVADNRDDDNGGDGVGQEDADALQQSLPLARPPVKLPQPRRHQCKICLRRFTRPSGLKTHMNMHSGAKPFKCLIPTCMQTFGVRSNARRHLRTHGIHASAKQMPDEASLPQYHDLQGPMNIDGQSVPSVPRWVPATLLTRTNVGDLRGDEDASVSSFEPSCPLLPVISSESLAWRDGLDERNSSLSILETRGERSAHLELDSEEEAGPTYLIEFVKRQDSSDQ